MLQFLQGLPNQPQCCSEFALGAGRAGSCVEYQTSRLAKGNGCPGLAVYFACAGGDWMSSFVFILWMPTLILVRAAEEQGLLPAPGSERWMPCR